VHFLICGNRNEEEKVFDNLYKGSAAEDHITFGGYRNDISEIIPGCYIAVIASTGWDSFPRSSLEMAAAGLPLLVSDLAGLKETVEPGTTGMLFRTGDFTDLADTIEYMLDNPEQREQFSRNSIKRVRSGFTLEIQKQGLIKVIQNVIKKSE